MKILLTINDISITGGAERVCVNLANAFAESGHEVEILSFYHAHSAVPYMLSSHVKLYFWQEIAESHFATAVCARLLGRLYYKNFYKILLSLKVGRRYRDIDIVISNDWTFTPYFKRKHISYIKVLHSIQDKYAKRNNYFDILVCLTHSHAQSLQQNHQCVKIIPNFLPILSSQNTDSRQKMVLSIGRMDDGDPKGFLRLIDIWEKVRQNQESSGWKLVIVGDGVLKTQIQSKIQEKNLQDSLLLKPFTKDIEHEYLQASIYVMTSYREGFGMVLLEASSLALPCLAFDVVTGPSDIIESEVGGYLIKDNNLQGFADKIIELMSDESKRKTMGESARTRVVRYFSKEAILPLWEELLHRQIKPTK